MYLKFVATVTFWPQHDEYWAHVILPPPCSTIEHLLPLFLVQLKDEVNISMRMRFFWKLWCIHIHVHVNFMLLNSLHNMQCPDVRLNIISGLESVNKGTVHVHVYKPMKTWCLRLPSWSMIWVYFKGPGVLPHPPFSFPTFSVALLPPPLGFAFFLLEFWQSRFASPWAKSWRLHLHC